MGGAGRGVGGRSPRWAAVTVGLGLLLSACGGAPSAEQREACGELRDLSDVLATVSMSDEDAFGRIGDGIEGFATAANRTDDPDLRSSARGLRGAWADVGQSVRASRAAIQQAEERARSAGLALEAAGIDWDEILGDDGVDDPPRDTSREEAEVTRADENLRQARQQAEERVRGSIDAFRGELSEAADACGSVGVPVDVEDATSDR